MITSALGRRRARGRGRAGIVFGAGGVLGAAWMTGALAAVQQRLDYPVEEAALLTGTSAGAILAAALHCGFGVADLVAHQRGVPDCALGRLCSPDLGCRSFPPVPAPRLGSPRLVWRALREPGQVHSWAVAAACIPRGREEHVTLRCLVDGLLAPAPGAGAGRAGDAGTGWAAGGRTWITAVDYDSGQRVVFGSPGAPAASLPDAVVASCSVPGWYRPTVIGGRRYIDGGVSSGTNADLMLAADVGEVYVLAPAASIDPGPARLLAGRLERYVRRKMTSALLREVELLDARGIGVTVLTPGPEDLAAIGTNLMDRRRRQAVFETSLRTVAAELDARRPLRAPGARRRAPGAPQRAPGAPWRVAAGLGRQAVKAAAAGRRAADRGPAGARPA